MTVFRPSIVFGENDSFYGFDKLLKFLFISSSLPKSKFQPIYVSDLTDFMISTINNSEYYNVKVDVVGPKVYSFIELIRLILKITKRKNNNTVEQFIIKIQAHVFQRFWKIFTMDNYNSLQIDSTSLGYQGHSTVEELSRNI